MSSLTPTGIAYDDTGHGQPTVLFLPGWCGPRTLFEPLRERLDDQVRCLSMDWRGHGESKSSDVEFGTAELVDDAAEVIAHAEAGEAIPVAVAHAGWVAIELRRRLGATRIPKLVLIDWMVTGAPVPFRDALRAMATPDQTRHVVDQVTDMWVAGLDIPELSDYVAAMRRTGDDMWARAAREIGGAFGRDPSPLDAIAALESPPRTLHLYAQPADDGFFGAQQTFAASHPWFAVERLDAESHFPMFEVPNAMAERIGDFLSG